MFSDRQYSKSRICDLNRYCSSSWISVPEFGRQRRRSLRVNAIFLSLCLYAEALKENTFIFNDNCMKNFVSQSVLSTLFSHLEGQPSGELVTVTYHTEIGCKGLMKRFRAAGHQSIGTMRKIAKDCLFQELGYYYIAGQRLQRDLKSFSNKKTEHIIHL